MNSGGQCMRKNSTGRIPKWNQGWSGKAPEKRRDLSWAWTLVFIWDRGQSVLLQELAWVSGSLDWRWGDVFMTPKSLAPPERKGVFRFIPWVVILLLWPWPPPSSSPSSSSPALPGGFPEARCTLIDAPGASTQGVLSVLCGIPGVHGWVHFPQPVRDRVLVLNSASLRSTSWQTPSPCLHSRLPFSFSQNPWFCESTGPQRNRPELDSEALWQALWQPTLPETPHVQQGLHCHPLCR